MPFARYMWEEAGFAESAARIPEVTPDRVVGHERGYVAEGHGVVLRGDEEYRVALEVLEAWFLANEGSGLTQKDRDNVYELCVEGRACNFRPLVWYMAHWRAQHPRG